MSGRLKRVGVVRTARRRLGTATARLLGWAVSRQRLEAAQGTGRRLGRVLFRLHGRYRTRALENIRLALGDELSDEGVQELARRCFEHLGMMCVEILRLTRKSGEEMAEVVRLDGAEHLHEALERGRGGILFAAHFGNWELGAARLMYEGLPLLPLFRAPDDPHLAFHLSDMRERLGFTGIATAEGPREILRALRDNHIVPILPDRFARGQGMTVPFFGQETHVWHTPALMAQRAGCPIIPGNVIRQDDGTLLFEIEPPVEVESSGDRVFDVWVAMARCMALLEAKIRLHPEQYTWPYRLWRPDETPPPPYPFEMLPPSAAAVLAEDNDDDAAA